MPIPKKALPAAAPLLMNSDRIEAIIRDEVRDMLKEGLDTVVVGELAKLRLMQPGSKALQESLDKKVPTLINTRLRETTGETMREFVSRHARELCRKEIEAIVKENGQKLRKIMADQMYHALKGRGA